MAPPCHSKVHFTSEEIEAGLSSGLRAGPGVLGPYHWGPLCWCFLVSSLGYTT